MFIEVFPNIHKKKKCFYKANMTTYRCYIYIFKYIYNFKYLKLVIYVHNKQTAPSDNLV